MTGTNILTDAVSSKVGPAQAFDDKLDRRQDFFTADGYELLLGLVLRIQSSGILWMAPESVPWFPSGLAGVLNFKSGVRHCSFGIEIRFPKFRCGDSKWFPGGQFGVLGPFLCKYMCIASSI